MIRTNMNQLLSAARNQTPYDSAAHCLQSHGLTWEPELETITTQSGIVAPWRAVVRSDNRWPLSIVGDRYTPTGNTEACQWLDHYKSAGVNITGCQSFKQGARNVMYATIGEPREVVKGDYVSLQLVAQWNHDSSKLNSGFLRAWRLACENGLVVAEDKPIFEYRHTTNGRPSENEIKTSVSAALDIFGQTVDQFQFLASRPITSAQVREYATAVMQFKPDENNELSTRASNIIDDIVSRWEHARQSSAIVAEMARVDAQRQEVAHASILDAMLGNMDAGRGHELGTGTYWNVYNAATEYLTHQRGRTEESRTESLLFGESARINQRAFQLALEMAS